MDWIFVGNMLRGALYTSQNILVAIPTYLALIPILLYIFAPKWGANMKKLPKQVKDNRINKLRISALVAIVLLIFISLILSANNLYQNKVPKFATPSELASPVLSGLNIRATDLVPVYSEPIVSGKIFENCTFYGPSVWSMRNNLVEEVGGALVFIAETGVTPETAIINTLNEEWIGVIIFENNVFKGDNKLHNISMIYAGEKAEKMREALRRAMEGLNK